MGKGDKKTRRGKIFMGSYGIRRPRKPSGSPFIPKSAKPVAMVTEQVVAKPVAQPKPRAEKPQVVEIATPTPVIEIQTLPKNQPAVETQTQAVEIKSVPTKKPVEKKAPAKKEEKPVAKEKKAPAKAVAKKTTPKTAAAKKPAAKKAAPKKKK